MDMHDSSTLGKLLISVDGGFEKTQIRCMSRLKKNREAFLNRFRTSESNNNNKPSLVRNLMVQEWKTLQAEEGGLPQLSDNFDLQSAPDDTDVEQVLSILEEIKSELLLEEQRILEEYEKSLAFDEAGLCAAIDQLKTDEVICPICKKNPLMQNKQIIFCCCGMRIDTELDGLNIANIKSQLEEGISLHNTQCVKEAKFSVMKQAGVENLLMTCETCDFMFIVI
ncbi:RPA-interacting protein A isoform X2 [Lingula anatina]|uniref:RPA-interacting protein A isoform X2 n=1 Tax=Lingula anatina TaxID=7574 RepID=A0A1S3K953_LINAN|nr:RPA-interacting protein A isoform X2 [Lingula anatina]|eukprot:XP_013419153.1 RPA-interacting protein A isoform X2 [Lingula anatina]